jgi:hypothetical protein
MLQLVSNLMMKSTSNRLPGPPTQVPSGPPGTGLKFQKFRYCNKHRIRPRACPFSTYAPPLLPSSFTFFAGLPISSKGCGVLAMSHPRLHSRRISCPPSHTKSCRSSEAFARLPQSFRNTVLGGGKRRPMNVPAHHLLASADSCAWQSIFAAT